MSAVQAKLGQLCPLYLLTSRPTQRLELIIKKHRFPHDKATSPLKIQLSYCDLFSDFVGRFFTSWRIKATRTCRIIIWARRDYNGWRGPGWARGDVLPASATDPLCKCPGMPCRTRSTQIGQFRRGKTNPLSQINTLFPPI